VDEKKDEQLDFMEVTRRSKLEAKPESEQDKRFNIVWKGVTTGMVVGLAIAQLIISRNSVFGIYVGGDVGVLLLGWVGGGAAIGALIEWLILRFAIGKKRR
jgi:hypothetical protein